MTADETKLDAERLYEDGKHRRYNLLFAVNGGAFAIAKLCAEAQKCDQALGQLTPSILAVGMMLFTAFMTYDIWMFGTRMKECGVFKWQGKLVLALIGSLISIGWLLAAIPWR
jgi:hypothetical protein